METQLETLVRDYIYRNSPCSETMVVTGLHLPRGDVTKTIESLVVRKVLLAIDGVPLRYKVVDIVRPKLVAFFEAGRHGTLEEVKKIMPPHVSYRSLQKTLNALLETGVIVLHNNVYKKKVVAEVQTQELKVMRQLATQFFENSKARVSAHDLFRELCPQVRGGDEAAKLEVLHDVLKALVNEEFIVCQNDPRSGTQRYQRFFTQDERTDYREREISAHQEFIGKYLADNATEVVTKGMLYAECENPFFLKTAFSRMKRAGQLMIDEDVGRWVNVRNKERKFKPRILLVAASGLSDDSSPEAPVSQPTPSDFALAVPLASEETDQSQAAAPVPENIPSQ
jgi:hypothetical protein